MNSFILFDIGGSNMRLAISNDGKTIAQDLSIPTSQNYDQGIAVLIENISKLKADSQIGAICGSIAGPLNKEKSILVNSPHLPDWISKPIKETLHQTFNVPIYLENDAALEALGEFTTGTDYGESILAYLTLGTGLGGARIVNGAIDVNVCGFEPGHQVIQVDNSFISIESLISGASIEKRYGKSPFELNDDLVWDEITKYFAISIHNTICYWSPDIVILGGSMMSKMNLDKIYEYINRINRIFPTLPKIIKSELNNKNGFYGALYYLSKHSSSL